MNVIACIDDSPAARPVLGTARTLAQVLHADAVALHVREDGIEPVARAAREAGMALRVEADDPIERIVAVLEEDEATLAVLGTRARRGGGERGPAGHVALAVAGRAPKPIVVVPPDAEVCTPGALKRLLVPLDGSPTSTAAVRSAVHVFAGSGAEVVVLHVFDPAHALPFMDRPEYDLEVWTREFLARHCAEPGARLEIRSGTAGGRVIDVAETERADMIALGWSQDLSPGHAAVVRDVLGRACIPVMLVPVARNPAGRGRLPARAT